MNNSSDYKTLSKPNKPKQHSDSSTKVHFSLRGHRKPVSFRCKPELWQAFKQQTKAQGQSVCHILESMLIAHLEAQVHFSNTIKPLVIEQVNVNRVLRRFRRAAVEEVVETVKVVGCGFCHKEAVFLFEDKTTGIQQYVCRPHANVLKLHPKWVQVEASLPASV